MSDDSEVKKLRADLSAALKLASRANVCFDLATAEDMIEETARGVVRAAGLAGATPRPDKLAELDAWRKELCAVRRDLAALVQAAAAEAQQARLAARRRP